MQFFAMQDRAVRDLLGSIVDSRAHPPPKSIHRVDSEATFGRPRASIHDICPQPKTARQCQHQPGRSTFAVNYNLSKCSFKSDKRTAGNERKTARLPFEKRICSGMNIWP